MIATIRAKYTNGQLTPLEPLDLEEGREVVISIEDGDGFEAPGTIEQRKPNTDAIGHEVVARGTAIYQEKVRPQVDEETHHGHFVVIDILSEDYEIDPHISAGTWRLLDRRPGAITYKLRIGYPGVYKMDRPRKRVQ